MKTAERVMEEWTLDEIEFDGGGPIKVWTRHQFTRLVEGLLSGDQNMMVSLWDQQGDQSNLVVNSVTNEVGHPLREFVDWRKAEEFLRAMQLANRNDAIDAQWLAHHRDFNEAIKTLMHWDPFDPRMIP